MKRLGLVLALATALALPAAVHAQNSPYRFELTPTLSYRWGGTLYGSDSSIFNTDLKVDDSEALGVTFDIPLSSFLQLELLANRQSSNLRFDTGLFGGDADVADIDVSYYHVGLLGQWGDRRVSPFFVASLGVTELNPDVAGASSENRFSVSLGGGVKVFFNDHVGMRFEGRGFVTAIDSGSSNHYCYRSDRNDYCYDNEFVQGQASVGLILAW
jgi:opacity protein-like surface antigen